MILQEPLHLLQSSEDLASKCDHCKILSKIPTKCIILQDSSAIFAEKAFFSTKEESKKIVRIPIVFVNTFCSFRTLQKVLIAVKLGIFAVQAKQWQSVQAEHNTMPKLPLFIVAKVVNKKLRLSHFLSVFHNGTRRKYSNTLDSISKRGSFFV